TPPSWRRRSTPSTATRASSIQMIRNAPRGGSPSSMPPGSRSRTRSHCSASPRRRRCSRLAEAPGRDVAGIVADGDVDGRASFVEDHLSVEPERRQGQLGGGGELGGIRQLVPFGGEEHGG